MYVILIMYVCVCMYVYIYIYIYIMLHATYYVCVYISLSLYIYIYIYILCIIWDTAQRDPPRDRRLDAGSLAQLAAHRALSTSRITRRLFFKWTANEPLLLSCDTLYFWPEPISRRDSSLWLLGTGLRLEFPWAGTAEPIVVHVAHFKSGSFQIWRIPS